MKLTPKNLVAMAIIQIIIILIAWAVGKNGCRRNSSKRNKNKPPDKA